MRDSKLYDFRVKSHTLNKYRTDEEFKEAYRTGNLSWSEIQYYVEWRKGELKDCRITLRISGTDMMKLKALARMQEKKVYSYMGEILKREIHLQEERLAASDSEPAKSP